MGAVRFSAGERAIRLSVDVERGHDGPAAQRFVRRHRAVPQPHRPLHRLAARAATSAADAAQERHSPASGRAAEWRFSAASSGSGRPSGTGEANGSLERVRRRHLGGTAMERAG